MLEGRTVRYLTVVELAVTGATDDLPAHVMEIADALHDLHDIVDPDLDGSFTQGTLDVSMIIEANDLTDAVKRSLAAVRAAIHAAGGATPGWEQYFHEAGARARAIADQQVSPQVQTVAGTRNI